MKSSLIIASILCSMLTMLLSSSCKKDKSESNGFDAEAQQSYETVMALQTQSMQVFDGFLATQDTSAAKVSLAAWFKTDATVEWAKVSAQGVTVKYSNGICGGLIIDLQRKKGDLKSLEVSRHENTLNNITIKNLPSKKKAVILAAYYNEFEKEVNEEEKQWSYDFTVNDGLPATILQMSDDVNLDILTTLNDYGIIDFNTHGIAWPDQINTEEVFMCSGEENNDETTKKYWNDIKQGTVGIFTFKRDNSTIYAIRPSFITKHNDFSKDTIMFYGGFCYSALGSWLDIVNSCAAGTYFGFNWKVNSVKCANWAISLIQNLSDHGLATPMTVEQWMSNTPIQKEYWDAGDKKNVKIIYNGYGGLTLWKPDFEMSGEIVSTEADGAPIKTKGFTCGTYTLKCSLKGKLPEHLAYEWDYGDNGPTYYTVDDNLALYHQWSEAKSYTVKVKITERYTGKLVKELKTTVSFIDPNYLPVLEQYTALDIYIGPGTAMPLSNGSFANNNMLGCATAYYKEPLTWADSSFTASTLSYGDLLTIKVKGNVSSDGKILRYCLITQEDYGQNPPYRKAALEITNMPILYKDQANPCYIDFFKTSSGSINSTYVTQVEYQEWNYQKLNWATLSGIDWSKTSLTVQFKK